MFKTSCPKCSGNGMKLFADRKSERCTNCGGTGEVIDWHEVCFWLVGVFAVIGLFWLLTK